MEISCGNFNVWPDGMFVYHAILTYNAQQMQGMLGTYISQGSRKIDFIFSSSFLGLECITTMVIYIDIYYDP